MSLFYYLTIYFYYTKIIIIIINTFIMLCYDVMVVYVYD